MKSLRKGFLSSLDGEFCIFYLDKKSNRLQIASDRFFCSIPLYYFKGSNFYVSHKYSDITKLASREKFYKLKNKHFFEFLWFRRLHGDSTYDNQTSFMKAASILSVDLSSEIIEKYWTPSFRKVYGLSSSDAAHELKELIVGSIRRKVAKEEEGNRAFS